MNTVSTFDMPRNAEPAISVMRYSTADSPVPSVTVPVGNSTYFLVPLTKRWMIALFSPSSLTKTKL